MAARFFARRTRREASTAAQIETTQGKELILKHKFEGHEEAIWSFVFLHDNIHIVSGSEDGTMRKWNCDTGLVVGEPWKGEGGRIYALALSPNGKIISCGRGDGSVQRWTTDGKMIKGVWMGHRDRVRSLSWSPSGSQIASGSYDGTILIRNAESGKVEVGPINAVHRYVLALAYSPSGDQIASCGDIAIYIWNTKTGVRVVGPIKGLGDSVTSLVWSSDGTKLYSASDRFARVFDSKSGRLHHRFEHNKLLWSIALSPKNNLLACVGIDGVALLWNTESHQPLDQPLTFDHRTLYYVTFSEDGRYIAYGGSDNKVTLWVLKDISPQIPPQQSDGQEMRPNSPLSSCLDADATGCGGFIEETHDDPYGNFFQCSQQSLPSPSPGFHLPSSFSALRFLNVFSRRRPPPDESIPQERSKRSFFSRSARSNLSLELTPTKLNQPMAESKVGEGRGKGEQGENVHDVCAASIRGSEHDSLNVTMDKGRQKDDSPANARSPPSYGRTLSAHLDSEDSPDLWERLMQARGKKITLGFLHSSTPPENAPHPILRNSRYWNSSSGSSSRPVHIAACRDEERYGITPETDEEAAAAMLRRNDDVADSSTRHGQPTVVAQVSQRRPTPTQALTSGPEIAYGGEDPPEYIKVIYQIIDQFIEL
ncbi:WD40 repeat-like protein [Suillus decipiens]|nr:WD40 repeat-like protein [Suillus decipiens]